MRLRPFALLLLALSTPLAPAHAALTLSFAFSGPAVSGATASGQVAWLGVALEPRQYFQEISEVRQTSTADASGVAGLLLTAPAPRRSLWVAVDVATGEFVVGTPEDYPIIQESLAATQLAFDSGNQATGLLLGQEQARVVLVRPGVGAWSAKALDGEAEDLDAEVNSALALSIAALEPMTLSTSAAPPAIAAGDVVILLDPSRLSVSATSVPASLLANGET